MRGGPNNVERCTIYINYKRIRPIQKYPSSILRSDVPTETLDFRIAALKYYILVVYRLAFSHFIRALDQDFHYFQHHHVYTCCTRISAPFEAVSWPSRTQHTVDAILPNTLTIFSMRLSHRLRQDGLPTIIRLFELHARAGIYISACAIEIHFSSIRILYGICTYAYDTCIMIYYYAYTCFFFSRKFHSLVIVRISVVDSSVKSS